MKKWIFSLALVISTSLSSASQKYMISHKHVASPRFFIAGEADYMPPESVRTLHLSVRPMEIRNFDRGGEKKLVQAFELLEKIVNSSEFKNKVINFKNTNGERTFASNNGLTNEEIYAQFMDGRETLQMNTPGEMNFYLRQYYNPWSRVIGYTSGSTNVISVNKKFFRTYGPHQVASNLAHEWTHKLGFNHSSAKEHDSAPYAIGYIVEEMALTYLKLQGVPVLPELKAEDADI